MKVLCVAEKNSIAKSVSSILGGGATSSRASGYTYVKNYDFTFSFSFTFQPQPANPSYSASPSYDVTMTSVAGHLTNIGFESSRYGWGKCNTLELFDAPISEIMDHDQRKIAENIRREARHADYLMIWTDCDREGEYIGYEIFKEAQRSNRRLTEQRLFRAVFSHLERNHILHAARHPERLDMRSVEAVSTRMELDLRTGVSFTRLLTDTMARRVFGRNNNRGKHGTDSTVISYGPCQFPTLGFVVDRFERIRHFSREEFWYIQLKVKGDTNGELSFTWDRGHLFDRLSVLTFYETCLELAGNVATLVSKETKPVTKYRPLPLTTVELQKNCARYFKLNAKQSLAAAEKLYQKGFISYPRTETDTFPRTMDLKTLIERQAQLDQPRSNRSPWADYAAQLLAPDQEHNGNPFQWPRAGSHDDKAHPPIHPVIALGNHHSYQLDQTERRVYEYVVRHFLACCSQDAQGQRTTLVLEWANRERFRCNGTQVLHRNFLDVYPWQHWHDNNNNTAGKTSGIPLWITNLDVGQPVQLLKAEMKSGTTTPPKPMTESELIMLMDANGIGTDATIAEHIEKIKLREYVRTEKVGRETFLQPTVLGIALVHGFESIGLEDSFAKPFQRREMEEDLKRVCDGSLSKQAVVTDVLGKYREYWLKTNSCKNTLLQVYDRTLATALVT